MTKADLIDLLVEHNIKNIIYPSATPKQREQRRHRDYWELHDHYCTWSRKKLLKHVFHLTLNKLGGL